MLSWSVLRKLWTRSSVLRGSTGLMLALTTAATVLGCAGSRKKAKPAETEVTGRRDDDRARCAYEGRDDREILESRSPGAREPNIRRVFGYIGDGEERRRILLCREVDTNLDGVKDVLRTYGDHGERLTEQADSDFDGRIDTWITFGKTRPAQVEFDKNRDGKPDETRFYTAGKVTRIQRDTNGDEKPDVFEIYDEGQLVRMGIDANFDGQVDIWHRDQLRAQQLASPDDKKSPEDTGDLSDDVGGED